MGSVYEDYIWKGEDHFPTLCLDDVSEIPFLDGISGVEEYQHRARVRAGSGDLFAAVTPPAEGYEVYCRDVLKLGDAELVFAESARSPIAVAEACGRGAAFRTIVSRARDAGGLLLHPYMSIEPVWELARRVASEAGVEVRVIGPPPPVTWIANDKKSFADIVAQTLGPEWLVRTQVSRDPAEIARNLLELARFSQRVGLKRTRCASAMGNEVHESKDLDDVEVDFVVRRFLERTEWDGTEEVLAVAWEDCDSSPSTQTWIPPRIVGKPIVQGVYEQILEGREQVFVGSRPSTDPIGERLAAATRELATRLQELGYVGRCSFDFIVSKDFIRVTECNGRWGGTSIPMSLMDRLSPEGRPPYRAQDFVREALVGTSFEEVRRRVGDELFDPATGQGRFVFYNVGPLARAGKLDVVAIGRTQQEAEDALEIDLPKLLR